MAESGAYSWLVFVMASGFIISTLMRSSSKDKRDDEELTESGGDNPWGPPPIHGTRDAAEIGTLENVLNDHDADDFPDAESVANTLLTNISIAETVYGVPVPTASRKYKDKEDKLILALSVAQGRAQQSFVELVSSYDAATADVDRKDYSVHTKALPDLLREYERNRDKLFEHVAVLTRYQEHNHYEARQTAVTNRVDFALRDYTRRQNYFEKRLEDITRFMEEHEPQISIDPLNDPIDDAMHSLFGTEKSALTPILEAPESNPPATRPTFSQQFIDDTPMLPSHESSLIPKPQASLQGDIARRLDFSAPRGTAPRASLTPQIKKQFTSPKQRPPPNSPKRSASRPAARRIGGVVPVKTPVQRDALLAHKQYQKIGALPSGVGADKKLSTPVSREALLAHQQYQEMGAYESGEDL